MRKIFFYLMAIAMLLSACQLRQESAPSPEQDTTTPDELMTTDVENRVKNIYATVFKVYSIEDSLRKLGELKGSAIKENRKMFNTDFCTRGLNRLFIKVNDIDSLQHAGEVGFFDADYWIMAQDWQDLYISDVEVLSKTQEEASVQFQLHNLGTSKPIALSLKMESGMWKIDNIVDVNADYDLQKAMQKYLKEAD